MQDDRQREDQIWSTPPHNHPYIRSSTHLSTITEDQSHQRKRAADLAKHPPSQRPTPVDLLAEYLNRTDILYDLQEVVRQLDQAQDRQVRPRSVQTIRHGRGGRRKITSRLTPDQMQDLIATFEAGSATRQQLAERYGIGLTSVAKLLREWREGKHRTMA